MINVPFPDHRLASTALRSLNVDQEPSTSVQRRYSLIDSEGNPASENENGTILRTEYNATTNRMLRVAVNGFMESLGVVLQVMEELDVDVSEIKSSIT